MNDFTKTCRPAFESSPMSLDDYNATASVLNSSGVTQKDVKTASWVIFAFVLGLFALSLFLSGCAVRSEYRQIRAESAHNAQGGYDAALWEKDGRTYVRTLKGSFAPVQ